MKSSILILFAALVLSSCAETSVQPLSQTMFKVDTSAAPACGREGARKVAFRAAAIQVIKSGGDKFVILGDQTGSEVVGGTYNGYGYGAGNGFGSFGSMQTYNSHQQAMVVKMLSPGDRDYTEGLSARQILGANWQDIVTKGVGNTCTED